MQEGRRGHSGKPSTLGTTQTTLDLRAQAGLTATVSNSWFLVLGSILSHGTMPCVLRQKQMAIMGPEGGLGASRVLVRPVMVSGHYLRKRGSPAQERNPVTRMGLPETTREEAGIRTWRVDTTKVSGHEVNIPRNRAGSANWTQILQMYCLNPFLLPRPGMARTDVCTWDATSPKCPLLLDQREPLLDISLVLLGQD